MLSITALTWILVILIVAFGFSFFFCLVMSWNIVDEWREARALRMDAEKVLRENEDIREKLLARRTRMYKALTISRQAAPGEGIGEAREELLEELRAGRDLDR